MLSDDERRPERLGAAETFGGVLNSVGLELRRRREAAYRLEADCGCADPLGCADPVGPSTYGMTPTELDRHARTLRAEGWSDWEIRVRLAQPGRAAC